MYFDPLTIEYKRVNTIKTFYENWKTIMKAIKQVSKF